MRIAVIGAGAAATSVLHELHRRFRAGALPEVHVLDGAARPGSGGVYRHDLDSALVNRQARCMSVHYDDQDDFVGWLAGRGLTAAATVDGEFYSRSLFGRYLEDRFDGAVRLWARSGAPLRLVRTYADELRESPDGVHVRSAGTGWSRYDHAILCTGHGRQDSSGTGPYPLADLVERARGRELVAVVGAGLTAMDAVTALLDAGVPRIAIYSRTGILPDVRADCPQDLPLHTPEVRPRGPLTVRDLRRALVAELRAHGIDAAELDRYLDRLRAGLPALLRHEEIPEQHRAIQNLCISLANRDLPAYWDAFGPADRAAFHDGYHRLLQAVCSPIPRGTARRLCAAYRDGRLRIERGALTRAPDGTPLVDGEPGTGLVVDATGDPTSAGQVEFERGLAATAGALAEPYGGIRVDRATGRLVRATGVSARIHVLGYATRGSLLYSSSLYQATRNAQVVAGHLARIGEDPAGRARQPVAAGSAPR